MGKQNRDMGDDAPVRLTYVSTRAGSVTDEDVQQIVAHANRANRGIGVTGCLWGGRTRFLHVIEGPAAVVEALFRRISLDPRHASPRLLAYARPANVKFGPWNMGYVAEGADARLDELIALFNHVTAPLPPHKEEPASLVSIHDRLAAALTVQRGNIQEWAKPARPVSSDCDQA